MIAFCVHRQQSRFFTFSIAFILVELTVSHCRNSKKSCEIFVDFQILEKWRLGIDPKQPDRKFWNNVFWIPNQNRNTWKCLFRAVKFGARNTTRRPKNTIFGLELTWFVGSTWNSSGTKLNSRKRNILSATFLVRYSKNTVSKYSVEPVIWDAHTQTSLSRDENPGRLHLTFLSFDNGRNLGQPI